MHIALTIYEQSDLLTDMARICNNLGAAHMLRSEQNTARTYLQRSLGLAERIGNLPSMTTSMGNLGDVAQRSGDLLESEEWFKRSIAVAERINDREGISWCSVELAKVQQDLGKLEDARSSLLRAINIGREIKSLRCVRYALVGVGSLRITEALFSRQCSPFSLRKQQAYRREYLRLLLRARTAIQRAIVLDELEVETIVDGKYLLASSYFFLDELEIANALALETLKEASECEITRIIGRIYLLLGRIRVAQRHFVQADAYFEQALAIFHKHDLRLDYARTLHAYGAALMQRDESSSPTREARQSIQEIQSRGLDYLREARRIYVDSHATLDIGWIEEELTQVEEQNVGKR